jgi:membrane protein implicated in regulation of membrane protease activity
MKVIRIISFVFVAAGILLLVLGYREYKFKKAFTNQAQATTGKVTEVIKRTRHGSRGHTSTEYHYRVVYNAESTQKEFVSDKSHSSPEYQTGDSVPVLYRSDRAEINTISLLWFNFGLLTVLGFCFAACGATNLWITELPPQQGLTTSANLRDLKEAYRSGRLTRKSEYQGLLVAFSFVGFALFAVAVMILVFAGTFVKILVGILAIYMFMRIMFSRRKKKTNHEIHKESRSN